MVEVTAPVGADRVIVRVSIRRADYWLVEAPSAFAFAFWKKVSIRRADYWLVEDTTFIEMTGAEYVSIRRADYWLVEVSFVLIIMVNSAAFQSAGRIIGWLKHPRCRCGLVVQAFQSAGRIIGWLKPPCPAALFSSREVSIRRADYWLVEGWAQSGCWRVCGVSIRRADYWLVEDETEPRCLVQG